MNHNQRIPSSRFREADADRLIATYGTRQPDDGRQKMKDSLRGVKKEFMAAQKEKQRERSSGLERGL